MRHCSIWRENPWRSGHKTCLECEAPAVCWTPCLTSTCWDLFGGFQGTKLEKFQNIWLVFGKFVVPLFFLVSSWFLCFFWYYTRWWFPRFFISTPTWGSDSLLTSIFSNGLKPPTSILRNPSDRDYRLRLADLSSMICHHQKQTNLTGFVSIKGVILLMEEIPNNHLGCIKPYAYWDIFCINWCRISSINSLQLTGVVSWFDWILRTTGLQLSIERDPCFWYAATKQ